MRDVFAKLLLFRARKRGDYSPEILKSIGGRWMRDASPASLFACASFRRDLGRPLPRRWISRLLKDLDRLPARDRASALAMILETDPNLPDRVLESALDSVPCTMPSLAHARNQCLGRSSSRAPAAIHAQQALWREQLQAVLEKAIASTGICVVGNSGALLGSGLGPQIDARAVTIRFNHCPLDPGKPVDFGGRTDIWTAAPNFCGTVPEGISWTIVSGPDVRFRLQDWSIFNDLSDRGIRVVTPPLSVWRGLVASLQAPPSAGILTLEWIRQMLGGWKGVSAAGIGGFGQSAAPYHALRQKQPPGPRHRWDLESLAVRHWQTLGLTILPSQENDAA